jgi:membrane fusion protein, heavy metal efflux system
MPKFYRPLIYACLLWLAACSKSPQAGREPAAEQPHVEHTGEQRKNDKTEEAEKRESAEKGEASEKGKADTIRMTNAQLVASSIEVAPVRQIATDSVEAPGMIDASPSRSEVVAVAVGGRITALHRNLGEPVNRGDVLAVVESGEAAQLRADLERGAPCSAKSGCSKKKCQPNKTISLPRLPQLKGRHVTGSPSSDWLLPEAAGVAP